MTVQAAATGSGSASGGGLTIVPVWDASVLNAPQVGQIEVAFLAAANYIESQFTDPITVYIDVGWGETNGAAVPAHDVASSHYYGGFFSYGQYVSALTADAKSADDRLSLGQLPATDPTGGGQFFLTNPLVHALGLPGFTSTPSDPDGAVGLNSATTWTFDPTNRAVAGAHDAVGAFEHEITEVLGRSAALGSSFSAAHPDVYEPLDLFRYTSTGGGVAHTYTPGPGAFSVDGQSLLLAFNDPTTNGGDAGDWANGLIGDSFGANYSGVASNVSLADLRLMDVIGYDRAGAPTTSAVFNDFSGDGHGDLLWRNGAGTFTTWDISGAPSGNQEQQNVYADASVSAAWQVQGTFDFNGDGHADILWRNTASGTFTVWDASGSRFAQNAYVDGSVGTSWSVTGLGDFNGDGKSDLLWRNTDGRLTEWQSTGTGFVSNTFVTQVDPSWHVVGVGDFNGDGKSDILWRNDNTGTFTEWQSTGSGFAQNVYADSSVDKTWHVEAVADFNGDGRADILWRNDDGAFTVWDSTGNGFTPNVYGNGTVDNSWHLAGTEDFNGDGRADLLWRNDNGTFTTWQSNGAGFDANVLVDGSVGTDWTVQTHHYDFV